MTLLLFLHLGGHMPVFPDDNMLPAVQEGIYQLSYSKLIRTNIPVLIKDDSVYVPMVEILGRLKVFYQIEDDVNLIKGFLNHKDSVFRVDFNNSTAEFGKNEILTINNNEFINDGFEVYVLPSFLNRLFNIRMKINKPRLKIIIDRRTVFPILAEYKRNKEYGSLGEMNFNEEYAPLKFERNRSFLNGGILNYDLSAKRTKDENYMSYNMNLGMEVLGGDLQVRSYGYYSDRTNLYENIPSYLWRYHISDNDYMSTVSLGELTESGFTTAAIPKYQMRGVQITNEPVQIRSYFDSHNIMNRTEPGWQVDLYHNGTLFGHTIADSIGLFEFDVPLHYGLTDLETRYYGPRGDYYAEKERIQIANDFLRPNEIRYTINAGERMYDNKMSIEGYFSYGLFDWLTNTVALGKTEDNEELLSVYNHLNARFFNGGLSASMDYAPGKLYQGRLHSFSSDFGSPDLTYTVYEGLSELNLMGMKNQLRFSYITPAVFSLPLNLQFRGNRRVYETNMMTDYTVSLNFRLARIYFRNSFSSINRISELTTPYSSKYFSNEIIYYWKNNIRSLPFIKNTSLRLRSNYDLLTNKFVQLGMSLEQKLFGNARLQVNYDRDISSNYNRISARLYIDFNELRSVTQADFANSSEGIYTQRFVGQLGYDSYKKRLVASNTRWGGNIGASSASVRLFLDENNNGKYDEDEYLLPDVKVKMQNGRVRYDEQNNTRIANNLYPYWQYNMAIDTKSIKNPLWVPEFTEFSMIADPSSFKNVDIPCYTAGIIEGSIEDVNHNPVSRVKIHVVSKDSSFHKQIFVFSDGSFYHMGLPPGDYMAYPDPMQMELMHYKTQPEILLFTVNRSIEGDLIDGLNFTVSREGAPAIASADENTEDDYPKNFSVAIKDAHVMLSKEPEPISETENQIIKDYGIQINNPKSYNYKNLSDFMPTKSMVSYLRKIIKYYREFPDIEINIIAYSDKMDNSDEALDISIKRANVLGNYLISKGISASKVTITGAGYQEVPGNGTNIETIIKDRRAEIIIRRK